MFKKLKKLTCDIKEKCEDIKETLSDKNLNRKLNIVILGTNDKKLKKLTKKDDQS
jgi:hypothetical protein